MRQTFVDVVKLIVFAPPPPVALGEGDSIQLLDFDVDSTLWRPGETHEVSLQWGVAAPVAADYQLFVHLRDAVTNEVMDQADSAPLGGWYPTSWWAQGETVQDERPFLLSPDVPPGQYNLVVGFYDLTTGERFGSEHILDTIEVVPPSS
jgi:hypothetical protein